MATTFAPARSGLPAAFAVSTGGALAPAELVDLVRAVAADESEWRPRLRLPAARAERWWTRLHDGDDVDVWLLSWLPGHTTELHDHGRSAAAFTVVEGALNEVRLRAGRRPVTLTRRPGGTVGLAPGVPHDVRGAGQGPAVSIHAYSPPLTRMTYWARGDDGVLRPSRTVLSDEPEERSG